MAIPLTAERIERISEMAAGTELFYGVSALIAEVASARADERRRCHAALKRVFKAFAAQRKYPSAEAVEVAWLAALAEED